MNAMQIMELEEVERKLNLLINNMDWDATTAYRHKTVNGAFFRPRQELLASLATVSRILAAEKAAFCFEAHKIKGNSLSVYEQINRDVERLRNDLWEKAIQTFKKQWEEEHINIKQKRHVGRTELPRKSLPRKRDARKSGTLTAADFED